jgi:hypothetical protein
VDAGKDILLRVSEVSMIEEWLQEMIVRCTVYHLMNFECETFLKVSENGRVMKSEVVSPAAVEAQVGDWRYR